MGYEIKELSVGGILDQAIKVSKDGAVVLMMIVGCMVVPLQIGAGLTQLALTPVIPPDATQEEVIAAQAQVGLALPIAMMGIGLLSLIVQPLTTGALIFAIADIYLGRQPTVGNAFGRALSRWLALVGTTILYALAVGAGFVLLIIPGIIATLWFYLYQPVVVLEEEAGVAALKRSRNLMKDNLGKAFTIGFLVFLIVVGVTASSALIPQEHTGVVVGGILQGLAMIFYAAVAIVFYFSTLCQHEAYDLKRLAEAVSDVESEPSDEPALGL
ncbi:hypothetical protein K2D_00670 [Planctomycetes bacterium K2D]|uniref:Glycerophosphoryl diester phosphodiesterase membrane domain-containing protein n=2 Tax=Botrimarina mediterranea TaxID=2528022 RepID=A0A518K2B2_9BACT|nr:hypothetical protein Spa11_01170 [Botrimarina mediterranea]QDV76489.1 hypothetical protein K2D_00670 [Planctomycetes bacterium K2D]